MGVAVAAGAVLACAGLAMGVEPGAAGAGVAAGVTSAAAAPGDLPRAVSAAIGISGDMTSARLLSSGAVDLPATLGKIRDESPARIAPVVRATGAGGPGDVVRFAAAERVESVRGGGAPVYLIRQVGPGLTLETTVFADGSATRCAAMIRYEVVNTGESAWTGTLDAVLAGREDRMIALTGMLHVNKDGVAAAAEGAREVLPGERLRVDVAGVINNVSDLPALRAVSARGGENARAYFEARERVIATQWNRALDQAFRPTLPPAGSEMMLEVRRGLSVLSVAPAMVMPDSGNPFDEIADVRHRGLLEWGLTAEARALAEDALQRAVSADPMRLAPAMRARLGLALIRQWAVERDDAFARERWPRMLHLVGRLPDPSPELEQDRALVALMHETSRAAVLLGTALNDRDALVTLNRQMDLWTLATRRVGVEQAGAAGAASDATKPIAEDGAAAAAKVAAMEAAVRPKRTFEQRRDEVLSAMPRALVERSPEHALAGASVLAARRMLVIERGVGGKIELMPDVPDAWFEAAGGVVLRNMPTTAGMLTLAASQSGTVLTLELRSVAGDGGSDAAAMAAIAARLPKDGIEIWTRRDRAIRGTMGMTEAPYLDAMRGIRTLVVPIEIKLVY